MALREQPYLPLYVQDFMTDEKLNECSAESTGVYIRLMCVMHKSHEYGVILLKQKDKQTESKIKNFALKLAKHMPYSTDTIERALIELLEEQVIFIEADKLCQKRMVRDGQLSETRSAAGKKRKKSAKAPFAGEFASDFATAKSIANSENENESENEDDIDSKNESESSERTVEELASPVITLPLNTGEEYPIFPERAEEWAGLYPAVDVIQQLREMRGWLLANPTRRKTKTGILRFVTAWLAKEQDKGGSSIYRPNRQWQKTDAMDDLRELHRQFSEE